MGQGNGTDSGKPLWFKLFVTRTTVSPPTINLLSGPAALNSRQATLSHHTFATNHFATRRHTPELRSMPREASMPVSSLTRFQPGRRCRYSHHPAIYLKPPGDTENCFGRPASRHASDPFLSSHFLPVFVVVVQTSTRCLRALLNSVVPEA
eukprot:COSAG06_NODE_62_length_27058_cov_17.867725_9_plen_151_part_00